MLINSYMMLAGNQPKVIRSARESSCCPSGEYTLSVRANHPSKKSKNAPNQIHRAACVRWPFRASIAPKLPIVRLSKVKKLGRCFFIFQVQYRSPVAKISTTVVAMEVWEYLNFTLVRLSLS